jgi:hypothetical protein
MVAKRTTDVKHQFCELQLKALLLNIRPAIMLSWTRING